MVDISRRLISTTKRQVDTSNEDRKRRKREVIIICIVLPIIVFLTYLGSKVFNLGVELPIAGSILIFLVININVILLLLLLYLTMRNLVKLVFERKKRVMGSGLRAKLVFAFVILSLLPTIIIFLFQYNLSLFLLIIGLIFRLSSLFKNL